MPDVIHQTCFLGEFKLKREIITKGFCTYNFGEVAWKKIRETVLETVEATSWTRSVQVGQSIRQAGMELS